MKSTGILSKRGKIIRLAVGTLLSILTLFLVFHSYSGLTYAIELNGNESGITVDQAEIFNISNLYPGQPPEESKQPLEIKNAGRSDFECAISSKLTREDSRLFNILKLGIKDEKGISVYSGNLKDLNKLSLGKIRPRESKLYNLTLELPVEVDNSYQALSTSFQFEIAAAGESIKDDDNDDDTNDDESERIDGEDRTDTAIEISQEGWPNGAPAVVLSRDDDFPDALAGAPLALKLDAPILLTNKEVLSLETEIEIKRLQAKTIYILGGTGAVSQGIEESLKNKELSVIRIGGIDRFETAVLIANRLDFKGSKVVIAYGYDFPDTLAISPWAAANSIPILLTQKDYLTTVTQEALRNLNAKETIVVGGNGVISDDVANGLPGMVRYGGVNRYQTNLSILEHLAGNNLKLCLATAVDYPDALVGAVLAAKTQSFILLVDEGLSEPKIEEFLSKHKGAIRVPYVFGGRSSVSDQVIEKIRLMK